MSRLRSLALFYLFLINVFSHFDFERRIESKPNLPLVLKFVLLQNLILWLTNLLIQLLVVLKH